jgi:hypothetical protein
VASEENRKNNFAMAFVLLVVFVMNARLATYHRVVGWLVRLSIDGPQSARARATPR